MKNTNFKNIKNLLFPIINIILFCLVVWSVITLFKKHGVEPTITLFIIPFFVDFIGKLVRVYRPNEKKLKKIVDNIFLLSIVIQCYMQIWFSKVAQFYSGIEMTFFSEYYTHGQLTWTFFLIIVIALWGYQTIFKNKPFRYMIAFIITFVIYGLLLKICSVC